MIGIIILNLLGCSDYEIKKIPTGPILDILYYDNDFGENNVINSESTTLEFYLYNSGDQDLEVYELGFEDHGYFDISSKPESYVVKPETINSLEITFKPEEYGNFLNTFYVESNDAFGFYDHADILGVGVAPKINVYPHEYDFLDIIAGCDEKLEVTIENIGNQELLVEDVVFSSSEDLYLDDNILVNEYLPWEILPGENKNIYVEYMPINEGYDLSYVNIFSNDPQDPIVDIKQYGEGIRAGTTSEEFEVPELSKVDIIFVIDNSGSMNNEQTSISNNAYTFINELDINNIDYKIAVITTDNPDFRGDVITYSTTNKVSEFQTQIVAGTHGDPTEMGMEMAMQCTSSGNDGDPLGEFMRSDANLAIVIISDENDYSPDSVQNYVSHFKSLKTFSNMVTVHAVAGDVPTNICHAQPGYDYKDATLQTGGLFISICDSDWASSLKNLAVSTSNGSREFLLSDQAIEGSMTVWINGIENLQDWIFDSASNSIVFTSNASLMEGDIIRIEYGIFGECE